MIGKVSKNKNRIKRHLRIRQTLSGTAVRPRLSVYRSNTAIYCQLIDDVKGITLISATSVEAGSKGSNVTTAQAVGKLIASKAIKAGISEVVFDRSGYLYHGKIKALADAARETGLKF